MPFKKFMPDMNLAKPISEQIEEEIKNQISRGDLKPGEQLPVMRTLAKEMGCGIVSVNKAIQSLKNQEVLYATKNRGVFVADLSDDLINALGEDSVANKLEEVIQMAKNNGFTKNQFLDLASELFIEE